VSYLLLQADAMRISLPDRSVDLVFGSPPYVDARLYLENGRDLGIARGVEAWVAWMLRVTAEALRVSRGAVVWVAAGKTKHRNYWPACEGLMWEWFKAGGHAYRPCYWHRVGIAGSGGDQWFRADVEYAMCFKRPGPLPWTDNTACGHPPKWAPGGAMSHRLSAGTRTNQWGKTGTDTGTKRLAGGVVRHGPARPSHETMTRKERDERRRALVENGYGKVAYGDHIRIDTGDNPRNQNCLPPALANPGNYLEVEDDSTWVLEFPTGGGKLGSDDAHSNEAPFPESLAEFFVKSLCPPGGAVLDCFSGSGTTTAVAHRLDRHGIGCDLRRSQCELGARRIARGMRPISKLDPSPALKPLRGQMDLFGSTNP
jgi:hypothetical protein